MTEKMWERVSSVLVILNGVICLAFSEHIFEVLPILCGSVLLVKGLVKFIEGILNKGYADLEEVEFERSIIIIAVAFGIIIQQKDALFVIGIFWGLSGLQKAVESFNIGFYNICNKEKYVVIMLKAVIECVLSLMLIFDPFTSVAHHILILGVELIFEGATEIFWRNVKGQREVE